MNNEVLIALAELGVEAKERQCCPIHKGDNPTAFHMDLDTGYWYCHTGCLDGGGLKKLAHLLGKPIPDFKPSSKLHVDRTVFTPKATMYELNLNVPIIDEPYRNIGLGTLTIADVRMDDDFVYFPIYVGGILVAFTKRTLHGEKRWINQPKGFQFGRILYNYDKVAEGEVVIITEGIIDALAFMNVELHNVVSSFGCHITEDQRNLLMRKTYQVALAFDNDEAGRKGTRKAYEFLKDDFQVFEFCYEGKDPCEGDIIGGKLVRMK